MKPTVFLVLLVTNILAAPTVTLTPTSSIPRVLGLSIEKRSMPDLVMYEMNRRSRILERQNVVSEIVTINDAQTLYYANITLGTPPQHFALHVDTGSSDLWVNSVDVTVCSNQNSFCEGGTYDIESSSTGQFVNSHFNITYADGSGATGDYVKDTLGVGGARLEAFHFGVGKSSTSKQGVLGLSYALNEVGVRAGTQPYQTLPQALFAAGLINRNAYSLWLNDREAGSGQILFGGINPARYRGQLHTIPVLKQRGGNVGFFVALSSIKYNSISIASANLPAPVLLDSGSSISYLPNDIVDLIYKRFDVEFNNSKGLGYAPCRLADSNTYLEFGFGEISIQVPSSELFLDPDSTSRNNNHFLSTGERACLFGIAPGDDLSILGDTFLRSAYVVFDLERDEISLAQTNFDTDIIEDSVREICVWQRRGPWCHG